MLVERARHDAVGGVESLFYAITVVNVNVDVQHALVDSARKPRGKDGSKEEQCITSYLSSSNMARTQSFT